MTRIAFILDEFLNFQAYATNENLETCATGLVAQAGDDRYVVRDFKPVSVDAYIDRTSYNATLKPQACMQLANAARANDCGVLVAHTHPGLGAVARFSSLDNAGERLLASYFSGRIPKESHWASVFTANGASCRELGKKASVQIQRIGKDVYVSNTHKGKGQYKADLFDRQVRAFGAEGQARILSMRVAIIGLGGTGSVVAQELAYLGVQKYLLIDPDIVESTNLNRLIGASEADVGKKKVRIAERNIKKVQKAAQCDIVFGDVVDASIARKLRAADFIFICTDSHASRAVVNQIAYQYLIPVIDMGVAIYAKEGRVTNIAGRVQMLAPGLPCLVCGNWLNSNEIRREMLTEYERKADPYFVGDSVTQPAVVSLNATLASVAITTFLAAICGLPSEARLLIYDGVRGSLRPTVITPQKDCIVCSLSGAMGRGDTWPLPTRGDGSTN